MKNNGKNPEGFENEYQSINRAERARNAPERVEHSDPPDTPTEAPAMETRPESARSRGISTEIQQMAPDYHVVLITLRDQYGIESRWMVPVGEPLSSDELECLRIIHVRGSQGETRRN